MWRREGDGAHYIDGASEPYNRGQEARLVGQLREWRFRALCFATGKAARGNFASCCSTSMMQPDRIGCDECCNQQQCYQHPMAAPRSGLQVGAELGQLFGNPLKVSYRGVPFLRAPFQFASDLRGSFIRVGEMAAYL